MKRSELKQIIVESLLVPQVISMLVKVVKKANSLSVNENNNTNKQTINKKKPTHRKFTNNNVLNSILNETQDDIYNNNEDLSAFGIPQKSNSTNYVQQELSKIGKGGRPLNIPNVISDNNNVEANPHDIDGGLKKLLPRNNAIGNPEQETGESVLDHLDSGAVANLFKGRNFKEVFDKSNSVRKGPISFNPLTRK